MQKKQLAYYLLLGHLFASLFKKGISSNIRSSTRHFLLILNKSQTVQDFP